MYRLPVLIGAAALAVIAAGVTVLAAGLPGVPPAAQSASVPAGGHRTAVLDIASGTTRLTVRTASLGGTGGTLLRVSTPAGAPVHPRLSTPGGGATARSGEKETVQLTLAANAGRGGGAYAVSVTLNSAVTWWLDFGGGTQRTAADLRGGRVAGVAFTAGSQIIDLTLPRPRTSVPVLLAGGASLFLVRAPSGVPVRVTAAGGAGTVSLDGARHTGVAGGSVFASANWTAAGPRYDVTASAGAAVIAVSGWRG